MPITVAPGSVVQVRDEEWLVSTVEQTDDGQLLTVQGLSDLVRGTTAKFYEHLDNIIPLDPHDATPVADASPHYRDARLWLEATLRKTPIPLGEPTLADAILDRLIHNAHPITLKGESMRKRKAT